MSTNSLNGVVGQPTYFAGDYLFRDTALSNNETLNSEEHILNNTLGRLQLTGMIDQSLTMAAGNTLTVLLQYKDSAGAWQDSDTLVSKSGAQTIEAGELFAFIPVPNDNRRIYRLQVTSNFDASAVKLTAAIGILPLA